MKSCWMYPLKIGKFVNCISEFRIKSCGIYPPARYMVEIWENLLFHVLSNDECKFAKNLFPIIWGPFENVNLLYFLLKIQIWNGCNVFNIAGNSIKDINVNLSFLSSRWKVVECTPQRLENLLTVFLSSGSKVVEYTPKVTSGVTLQCIVGMTIVTSHSCFQLCWVCTAINFGSNFGYFLAVKQVGTVLYLCILAFLAVKQVVTVWKFCGIYPPRYLVEIWENLLFHVLSNEACKFAINLFPITWGPCENVNLLYFLLKIQIWNGCNVFNIAGNSIKDINVNLSFLSSRWKVVELVCTPNGIENIGILWWAMYFGGHQSWGRKTFYPRG